jgi:hypothetical protein
MPLEKNYKSILWEYDLSKLNLDDDIVVERVLNLWKKDLTDLWIKQIGKKKVKELFIKNSKFLDKKSLNYWKIIFDLEKENLKENLKEDNRTMYEKLNTPIFTRSFR